MHSEIRKNDVNLQAQVKPLPIYGLASDLTPTLRNRWRVGEGRQPRAGRGDGVGTTGAGVRANVTDSVTDARTGQFGTVSELKSSHTLHDHHGFTVVLEYCAAAS